MNTDNTNIKKCCFLGHRKILITKDLENKLYNLVESLILSQNVSIFLFGSKSKFNDFCYTVVTDLKKKYPYIKRIYIRAEFPFINNDYINYLLGKYEDTYYPEKIINAGKAVYIERNYEMIDNSDFCIVYYNENCIPIERNSGTKIAYNYAIKHGKKIYNLC